MTIYRIRQVRKGATYLTHKGVTDNNGQITDKTRFQENKNP